MNTGNSIFGTGSQDIDSGDKKPCRNTEHFSGEAAEYSYLSLRKRLIFGRDTFADTGVYYPTELPVYGKNDGLFFRFIMERYS